MTSELPLIHFAESYYDSDMFFLSGFLCPDPFLWVEGGGRRVLGVSAMESARARAESRAHQVAVLRRARRKGRGSAVADLLARLGIGAVRVLPSFPLGLARELEGAGVRVALDAEALAGRRRKKTRGQIAAVASVQRRVEEGFWFIRN